jgi:pimeloyl-ACP methyl ester carboxylesterase
MQLFYRKYGEGTPLIIIHGLYGASDNWHTVGKALAEHFEVYLIDQRNHGRSPHAPEHTYRHMCADLLELMDNLHLSKAILIGHSMGGKTAMRFAVSNPERVQALLVVDIAPKSYNNLRTYEHQTVDHQMIISTLSTIDLAKAESRLDIEHQLAERIASERTRQFLLKNLTRSVGGGFRWKLNIAALANNLPAILEGISLEDFVVEPESLGFPVLFIRGANSDYILADDADLILELFPYAETVTIPNAGHWVHAEQPRLLVKNILYFLL